MMHCETQRVSVVDPLPTSRHHLNYDDCLKDKRDHYQNCYVLCCVRQFRTMIDTHTYEQFFKMLLNAKDNAIVLYVETEVLTLRACIQNYITDVTHSSCIAV